MLPLLFAVLFLLLVTYSAYWPWFRPEVFLKGANRRRRRLNRRSIFAQIQSPTIDFLSKHPSVDIWLARIGTLFLLLVGILAILAALSNPASR
jgi:hypothetical protein